MSAVQIHDTRLPFGKIGLVLVAVGAVTLAGIGAWFLSRPHALVVVPTGAVVEPSQIMIDRKDLPTQRISDFSLVFE